MPGQAERNGEKRGAPFIMVANLLIGFIALSVGTNLFILGAIGRTFITSL